MHMRACIQIKKNFEFACEFINLLKNKYKNLIINKHGIKKQETN